MISDSEKFILEHLAEGFTGADIAKLRKTSVRTIQAQVHVLKKKLGAQTQEHAVSLGYQRGVLQLPATDIKTAINLQIDQAVNSLICLKIID